MPKQIKSNKLSPHEVTNARLSIAALTAAFAFGGTFMALLSILGKETDKGAAIAVAVSCCFALYLVMLFVHCIHGIVTFEKQEKYGVLMSAVLTGFSAFTAILNVQFMTALFLTAIGQDDTAKSVIGGRGFDEFMAGQRTSWILMILGVAAAIVAGLTGIVKLGRNVGKR